MQVYLPAITRHVLPQMVKALAAFLDFCYLIHRSVHTEATLHEINEALAQFHEHCQIFEEEGVHPEGLSLPCQHLLVHYKAVIQLFGSPNSLCSLIMESKHIKAVKEPWRCSSHYKALGQMLLTNQCLDKLAASRVDFISLMACYQGHSQHSGLCQRLQTMTMVMRMMWLLVRKSWQRYSSLALQVCSNTLFLVCDLLHLPLQPMVIPIKFMNYHCISAFCSHPLSSIISKPFFLTNFILMPLSLAQNNCPTSFPYLMGTSKYSIPPSLNFLHPVIQPVSEGCIVSVYEPHPPGAVKDHVMTAFL